MKKDHVILLLILFISFLLNITGINWGVPSIERNKLYFDSEEQIRDNLKGITEEKLMKSQTAYKKEMSGSRFNPVRSYHPDESQFIESFNNMNPKKFDFSPHLYYYGTLYFILLGISFVFSYLFGYIKLTRDLSYFYMNPQELAKFYITGRMVSVIFGVLIVFMVYLIAKKIYSEKRGLIACLAAAAMPLFVIQIHIISVDITALFFILATLYSALKIFETEENKRYIYSGILAGLAAGAKYPAFIIVFVIPVAYFLKGEKTFPNLIKSFFNKKVFLSYLSAVISFSVTNPFIFISPGEVISHIQTASGYNRGNIVNGMAYYLKALYHGMGFPLFVLSLSGAAIVFIKKRKEEILILFWIIFALLVFSSFDMKYQRYILTIMPFMVILGMKVLDYLKNKYIRGLILVLVFALTFFYTWGYEDLLLKENIRTTAGKWIAENILPGETIGLRRDPWQFQTPPINQSRYGLLITGMERKNIIRQNPRYFIISQMEYDEDAQKTLDGLNYKMAKKYSNPPKVFGIPFNCRDPGHDYLYIYPEIYIFRKK